jgi:oxygen-independent coproporphyrinogen-3 oxidase
MPAYIRSLIKELRVVGGYFDQVSLHSIYFGGGTPSLIPVADYELLLNAINSEFSLTDNCEVSLEANPGTLTYGYLDQLHQLGINRLSIGVQSTDSFDLKRLDRAHTIDDILKAHRFARRAGFTNINLDLIYNLPWQDLASWENSLRRAMDLSPEHFSLYGLTIEPGTQLFRWFNKGLIAPQKQDLEADMYELAMEMLKEAGFVHYEVSNWAKDDPLMDYRSRHNMQYWLNLPYIGVGAGAHGYLGGNRTENVLTIPGYIQQINAESSITFNFPETPATAFTSVMDEQTQMRDFMWLGLRMLEEGVSSERFFKTFGRSMSEVFEREIATLLTLGFVRWEKKDSTRLRLTQHGLMLANQVFMQFV